MMRNFFTSIQKVDWWPIDQGAIYFCHYNQNSFCKLLFDEYSIPFVDTMHKSVEKRQAEYLAGRYCAKNALNAIGMDVLIIPSGEYREPLWPQGIRGSISHSNKFATACVSRSPKIAGIGIDLEEIIDTGTMSKIQRMIFTDRDRDNIAFMKMTENQYFSLVFSLKESFFKAVFSQVGNYFDFDAISIIDLDETKCSVKFIINYNLNTKLKKGYLLNGWYRQLSNSLIATAVVIHH